ncbi:MAG: helicase-exonuclease AddAB subunit AddA [Clostridia bacterium]|nr:helicase-exonuclease AddAB subunit AddA [Clostridia bacterium]
MSERKWTDEQLQSMDARGGSLLISAAAGSGKTAVLVERIVRLITDEENPVDVDRLLVVTYTRAAAAELRQRLSSALSKKMAEDPDNPRYQRQQMLLPRANISTVHGFCTRLLQEYAGQTGLPIGFRVAEETQTSLLSSQAMDEVLEEQYRRRDPAFMALATQLNTGRNDAALRTAMEQAYTFMQAKPFPEKWLQEQIDAYTAVTPLEKTPWMKPILDHIDMLLEYAVRLWHQAYEKSVAGGIVPYIDSMLAEYQQMSRLREWLPTATYAELQATLTGIRFESLTKVVTKDPVMLQYKEEAQKLRNEGKKLVSACADLVADTEEECRADLAKMAPLVDALGRLVREYTARFTALKRQEKLLDYNDLEHETLRLLVDPQTERPTPLAVDLSRRFSHIMVDEYQDTNAAQDALFTALSRNGQNLFFVGDVKQSIYGFRQAMPFLFTKRRKEYTPFKKENTDFPATITLKNNFRSRAEVTDAVNFIFRQLMDGRFGGVTYGEDDELKCSAEYPDASRPTEWLLLDKRAAEEAGITAVQMEARQIAHRIRELMQDTPISVGKDGFRPMEYKDICILLRSRTHLATYVKELAAMGIPAAADKSKGFLTTPEVRTAMSLLRVIDNPLREVELTAVMLSPLFGFTADDLATLRVAFGRYLPLYVAVEKMATEGDDPDLSARCAILLNRLRRLRVLAVSLPADRLLETAFRETDMEAVFAARSGGRQRVANLHRLDGVARGFEQGGFRGLSAFVRYMDRLEDRGKDLEGGDTLGQDGVRLMTVHSSKGLEFPVVFLVNLGGQGNKEDSGPKLLFHHETGIGLKLADNLEGEKHLPLPYRGVLCSRKLDEAAEELRVWYVALTRAREKLILTYTVKDPAAAIAKAETRLSDDEALLPAVVLRSSCPGDMLLTASLRHPDFVPYRQSTEVTTLSADEALTVTVCDTVAPLTAAAAELMAAEDTALTATLRQRMDYTYPYTPLLGVPAMLAASQLSHQKLSRQYVAQTPPAFLQKEGLTAAQKGTALHTFMQYADFAAATADSVAEAQRLLSAGFLTAEQTAVIPHDKLERFFAGDLYRRMAAADEIWREYHFIVDVPAGTLSPDLPEEMAGETVVVQGIADCVFREGDHLVLVDYKTDRVTAPAELIDRYRSQLSFYKQALETIFDLPVTEMLLYSFALDKTVAVK